MYKILFSMMLLMGSFTIHAMDSQATVQRRRTSSDPELKRLTHARKLAAAKDQLAQAERQLEQANEKADRARDLLTKLYNKDELRVPKKESCISKDDYTFVLVTAGIMLWIYLGIAYSITEHERSLHCCPSAKELWFPSLTCKEWVPCYQESWWETFLKVGLPLKIFGRDGFQLDLFGGEPTRILLRK